MSTYDIAVWALVTAGIAVIIAAIMATAGREAKFERQRDAEKKHNREQAEEE